ncbi:hypothetical protein [Limosilactobacillus reuteri]|nr:hypothetical protein [Limosilactobacillus reuteri]
MTLFVTLNLTYETVKCNYNVPANAKLRINNYYYDQNDTIRPYEAKVYQY